MKNTNPRKMRCGKCKNKFLRLEPACISCSICGWVKAFKADRDDLLRQLVLNGQYGGYNKYTACPGVYHIIEPFMFEGKDWTLTIEEQEAFRPSTQTTPESIVTSVGWIARNLLDGIPRSQNESTQHKPPNSASRKDHAQFRKAVNQ